jgi:anti-sigma factor (TIGR02949 family)
MSVTTRESDMVATGMISLKALRPMSEIDAIAAECRAIRGLLDAYLSGELTEESGFAVRTHLATCDECARLHEGMGRVRAKLREAVRSDVAPDSLKDSILKRIRGE